MDLDRRAAAFGSFVDAHYRPARWAGIALGAIVLLIWPSPTLSVLVWIVALVALYIGALEWLRSKAPAQTAREAVLEDVAAAEARAVEQPAGDLGPSAPPLPLPRPPANGALAPALTGARTAVASPGADLSAETAPPSPARTLEEPVLSPEVLSSLSGRLDLLVRLGQAHEAGVLTEEEFAREKARLLGV
jgi:hypothetical protein